MSHSTFPRALTHLSPLRSLVHRPRTLSLTTSRSRATRRGTLRDLYTSGLVSIFRRDSVLRVWEPLRETPRRPAD